MFLLLKISYVIFLFLLEFCLKIVFYFYRIIEKVNIYVIIIFVMLFIEIFVDKVIIIYV